MGRIPRRAAVFWSQRAIDYANPLLLQNLCEEIVFRASVQRHWIKDQVDCCLGNAHLRLATIESAANSASIPAAVLKALKGSVDHCRTALWAASLQSRMPADTGALPSLCLPGCNGFKRYTSG